MVTGHSLKLNIEGDLTLDVYGNIATCTGDEAIVQDVGCAIRLFKNDAWYEPEKGLDHFNTDLGNKLVEALIRSRYAKAAMTVPGVNAAMVSNIRLGKDRAVNCTVVLSTVNGEILNVEI